MGTIIGDYIGTTIGIQSPIPYSAPDSRGTSHIFSTELARMVSSPLSHAACSASGLRVWGLGLGVWGSGFRV